MKQKKTLAAFVPFEDALSLYAEAYHALHSGDANPMNALAVERDALITAVEAYYGRRRGRKSVRIVVKL